MEAVLGEGTMSVRFTSRPLQQDARPRERGHAALLLTFVVAGVITVAWVAGLFLGIRGLLTAIF
jgi:hypothetical protein